MPSLATRLRSSTWTWDVALPVGVGLLAILVGLSLEPAIGFRYMRWFVYAILALSLSFVWGKGGIFSFGQTLFFGVAGYAYGATAINLLGRTNETLSAVAVGILVATLVAAVLAYFMFYGGVADVYVAVITLAATLVFLTVVTNTAGSQWHIGAAQLGGFNGMTPIPPLTPPGGDPILRTNRMVLIVGLSVAVYVGLATLLRTSFGRIVAGIKANDERARLLGYDSRRYNLILFTIGGAIAALAGALFASGEGIVTPQVFGLALAGSVVVWVMVGGRHALGGAFAGAIVINVFSDFTDHLQIGGVQAFFGQTPLVLGLILIGLVLLLPNGLASLAAQIGPRRTRRPEVLSADAHVQRLDPHVLAKAGLARSTDNRADRELKTVDLSKAFGGLLAVDSVTIALPSSGLHCLLGPNGAGKSTLFALIAGRLRPTKGQITLGEVDLTRMPAYRRAQLGVGIKLQVPSVFGELSVRENLWLAAYSKNRDRKGADAVADGLLSWLGLESDPSTPANILSHGLQQWLEIAMVLAASPHVVMLDEPTAGMTQEETVRMAEVLRNIASQVSVIVVEHDIEFVRLLGCPITVLHEGRFFAQGSLEELRKDPRVLEAYLGRKSHA